MQSIPNLGDLQFFRDAESDVLERAKSGVNWVTVDEGATIIDYDDVSRDVFFIESGKVRVIVRTPGGREVIFGDLGPGQFFGELGAIDEHPRSANVTAVQRSRVCVMSAKTFLDVVFHSPTVCHRLLRTLAERLRVGNTRLVEQAALPVKHRLFAELIRLARPRPGSEERVITPPPYHHELAARIGARREAVSREMASLERQGTISKTRGAIVLKRPDVMEAAIAAELAADHGS